MKLHFSLHNFRSWIVRQTGFLSRSFAPFLRESALLFDRLQIARITAHRRNGMKKFIVLLVAFGVGLLLPSMVVAEEGGGHKTGDKGTITGEIIKKDGAKITVKGEKETLMLIPYWHGGNPPGGGFDKETVAKLKEFKVGDHVKVAWTFQEHYRIDSIEKIGGGDGGGDKKREEK
jgi:hypothetical protein